MYKKVGFCNENNPENMRKDQIYMPEVMWRKGAAMEAMEELSSKNEPKP